MMKKIISSLIFIFFCAAIPSSFANDELRVVYAYGHGEVLHNILQEFSDRTKIPLQSEFMDQSVLKTSIMAMMELNTLPDAIILPADHLGLHNFIKYSEIDPRLFKASIPDRIWGAGMSDGKLYGAPLIQGNHLMMYYNKSLIKEPARDWQVMLKQKAELEAKGISTIAWSYSEPFWFLPFLGAFGGWPLKDGKVNLNTPEMIAALDFFKDMLIKQPPYPNCDHQCIRTLFNSGKVAYTINGEWEGADFFKTLGDKLGVSAIPMAHNKKMVSAFSTYVIAFPNGSLTGKKRVNLIQLANYLQSPKAQEQIWVQVGAIPVEATAFAYAQKTAKDYLQQTLALMTGTKPIPADQAMSFVWDAIEKGGLKHRKGALNSTQAALHMQQLAERYIRNAQAQSNAETQPD